jgi:hypothetical protein
LVRRKRGFAAEIVVRHETVTNVRPVQSRTFGTHACERTAPLGPKTLDIVLSSGRRPDTRGVPTPPERICAQGDRIAELRRRCNSGASTISKSFINNWRPLGSIAGRGTARSFEKARRDG